MYYYYLLPKLKSAIQFLVGILLARFLGMCLLWKHHIILPNKNNVDQQQYIQCYIMWKTSSTVQLEQRHCQLGEILLYTTHVNKLVCDVIIYHHCPFQVKYSSRHVVSNYYQYCLFLPLICVKTTKVYLGSLYLLLLLLQVIVHSFK